jgi:RNA polymerase sigma-70 factor (ECF subfamily)
VRGQDDLYERAASEYGAALVRLARGYEADPDKRRDLLQEIHIALWRSLEGFDGLCAYARGFIAWRTMRRPRM